jgi:hypothetical protein
VLLSGGAFIHSLKYFKMKKSIFSLLVFALLGFAACREGHSHEGDHQHKPGDEKHEGHGTAADTMHHEHAPGDTSHNH